MFSCRESLGKGVGCFANLVIEPGTLLMSEAPSISMDDEEIMDQFRKYIQKDQTAKILKHVVHEWEKHHEDTEAKAYNLHGEQKAKESLFSPDSPEQMFKLLFEMQAVIKGYQRLSIEDKEKFLNLADSKSRLHLEVRNTELALKFGQIKDISLEMAAKVLGIAETNSFQKGVFLRMSRFNHSCRPNAEYFWNKDSGLQDLRAIRRIEPGEEISISYILGLRNPLTREGRRSHLRNTFNFECECQVCSLEGKPLEEDEKVRGEVMEENGRTVDKRNVDGFVKAALKCGGVGLSEVTDVILEEAFKEACSKAVLHKYNENKILQYFSKRKNIKAATYYASEAEKLSRLLRGSDQSSTQMWRRRKQQPLMEFTRQSSYIRHWVNTA